MGRPAFNASISASVSSGSPSRWRLACSIARNELLSALLGKGEDARERHFRRSWVSRLPSVLAPWCWTPKPTHRLKTRGLPPRSEEYSRSCQVQSIGCVICFSRSGFSRHSTSERTRLVRSLFGVPLFVVTKRVLHSKTWLEHCILAKVGVCYRHLVEVETVRAWGRLR